jgi:hypothetical protein
MSRDLIEPARKVLAIEGTEPTVNDQKYVLDEIRALGLWPAQSANPSTDLAKEAPVDIFESERDGRRRPRERRDRLSSGARRQGPARVVVDRGFTL